MMLSWPCAVQLLRVTLASSRSSWTVWSFASRRGGVTCWSSSRWIVWRAASSPRWRRSPWRASCVTNLEGCISPRRRTGTGTS
nr:MAG TPA: hypothetical protein [Caudoviricetes sp.]